MLKLGCILLNLANVCLHSSTSAKFHLFTEGDEDLLSKVRENMVGGPSLVCARKATVDEIHIRKSTNVFANRFLELMLADFTLTQCVNL